VRIIAEVNGRIGYRDTPHWLGDYWDVDVRDIQYPRGKTLTDLSLAGSMTDLSLAGSMTDPTANVGEN